MAKDYCIAPQRDIVITSNGKLSPCCTYLNPIDTVEDFFNTKESFPPASFKEVNDLFEQNATPVNCVNCFRKEIQGLNSKRKKLISRNEHSLSMEISFSNQCNLDCVMCTAEYSTKLVKLHKKFMHAVNKSLYDHHSYYLNKRTKFKLSADDTVSLAKKSIDRNSIEIVGGEPFLFEHLNLFFESLLRENHNLNYLSIVTNGTFITKENLEVFKAFKNCHVNFQVSVDGVGDIYKYIRGIDFSVINESMRVLSNFSSFSNITINVKPTFTFINSSNLSELINWVHSFNNSKINLVIEQFLSKFEPLSLGCVNSSLRKTWCEKITNSFLYNNYQTPINEFIKSTLAFDEPSEEQLISSREAIKILDEHRKMKLYDLVPELENAFN